MGSDAHRARAGCGVRARRPGRSAARRDRRRPRWHPHPRPGPRRGLRADRRGRGRGPCPRAARRARAGPHRDGDPVTAPPARAHAPAAPTPMAPVGATRAWLALLAAVVSALTIAGLARIAVDTASG